MKQKLMDHWRNMGISEKVINAFSEIKRENFIPKKLSSEAYADHPLPIGKGQTISQPTTVIIMTDALEVEKNSKILESGTGSGYQAAILSKLTENMVFTTEIIPELAESAKENLKDFNNVDVIESDGSIGHEKQSPYDRIMITSACPKIPEILIEQLKDNGIIVAPVGSRYSQKMVKLVKEKEGIKTYSLGDFVFVPLKGEHGFT